MTELQVAVQTLLKRVKGITGTPALVTENFEVAVEIPQESEEQGARDGEEWFGIVDSDEESVKVKLMIAISSERSGTEWPRCVVSKIVVRFLGRQPKEGFAWRWRMTKIQQAIVDRFIGCLCSKSRSVVGLKLFGSSEPKPSRPRISTDIFQAVAEVISEVCAKLVCQITAPSDVEANADRPDFYCFSGPVMWRDEVPKQREFGRSSTAPPPRPALVDRRRSNTRRAQSQGALQSCLPEVELDRTPWDGPTKADDSRPLWEAVWHQNVQEVQDALAKIDERARRAQAEEPRVPDWKSRVMEHRRRFRRRGNPKELVGSVLLLAILRLEQSLNTMRTSDSRKAQTAVNVPMEIVKLLIEHKADVNAMYKAYPCGKQKAMCNAPLCYAAMSRASLKCIHDLGADLGKKALFNYHSHGTVLWQAAWTRDDELVRYVIEKAETRYEVIEKRGSDVMFVSAEIPYHGPEAKSAGAPDAYPALYLSNDDHWDLEYLNVDGKPIKLRCDVKNERNQCCINTVYADYCRHYNQGLRGERPCLKTSAQCKHLHKRMPDDVFHALAGPAQERRRPPTAGWVPAAHANTHYQVQGTHMAKGWHPDFPPLQEKSQEHRCTALGIAIMKNMDCVTKLMQYGYRIDEQELEFAFVKATPDNFRVVFDVAAQVDPEMLLKTPRRAILRSHPKLLEQIWSEISSNDIATEKIIKAVQTNITKNHGDERSKAMVIDLIGHAPKAAAILLDNFFLQRPHVSAPNRNPLPSQSIICRKLEINTVYQSDLDWTFDSDTLTAPEWQSTLTGLKAAEDMYECTPASDIEISQFCEVNVVHFSGILRLEVFWAIQKLSYFQQIELLMECTTLKAVVCETWNKWTFAYHRVLIAEDAIQLLAVLVWGIDLASTVRRIQGEYGVLLQKILWVVFAGTAAARVVYDVILRSVFGIVALKFRGTENMSQRVDGFYKKDALRELITWLEHFLALNLASVSRPMIDGERSEESDAECMYWIGIHVIVKFIFFSIRLQYFSRIGELLIPTVDAFRAPRMLSMLTTLVCCVTVTFLFVFIVWPDAGEETENSLKGTMVKTWVNLVVGEPTLFSDEGNEGGWNKPWELYLMISLCHLAFAVVIMNMLMALTFDVYRELAKKSRGLLLRKRASLSRRLLWQRRIYLTFFCNLLKLNVHRVIFWMFVTIISTTCCLASFTDLGDVSLFVIFALYWGMVLLCTKMYAILRETPMRPDQIEPNQKWWITEDHLWVCVPKKFDDETAVDTTFGGREQTRRRSSGEDRCRSSGEDRADPADHNTSAAIVNCMRTPKAEVGADQLHAELAKGVAEMKELRLLLTQEVREIKEMSRQLPEDASSRKPVRLQSPGTGSSSSWLRHTGSPSALDRRPDFECSPAVAGASCSCCAEVLAELKQMKDQIGVLQLETMGRSSTELG